jgi:nitrite reductase/ring-hydroxylating ferredoxin subunit
MDQASFAALFKATNYRFRFFDLILESGGTDVDAEFNYKDLAHLEVVHNAFNVFYSHVSEDLTACVLLKPFCGLTFPMTHVSMQLAKNHLFFHDSILNVIMTSEVRFESLPDCRVRVTTRYGVGAPKLLLPLVYPLFKRLLTRSYDALMKDDVPMRDRRGQIRRWGVVIAKTSYGFAETLDIRAQHVFAGGADPIPDAVEVPIAAVSEAPTFIGRSDHLGLQLFRRSGAIEIYPRMCPHEGACLDRERLGEERALKCGWHGRLFGPVVRFPVNQTTGMFTSAFHRFTVAEGRLRIEALAEAERGQRTDWSLPATAA